MALIKVDNVSKLYKNTKSKHMALSDFCFEVNKGEFVTFFGPNGSGKSTLFDIISGLEVPTSGSVDINSKKPSDIKFGMVFQNYAESLFPWLTVLENVTFPLEIDGLSKKKSIQKSKKILTQIGLWEHKDKYIYQLSGGLRQLVSIARAFINNPEVLLMDEPCSALDYSTTKLIELEILNLWRNTKITTLVISHDIDEAIFLADKVIIISPAPGSVVKTIPVNLSRPRTLDMITSPKFNKIRNEIIKIFMNNMNI